MKVLISTNIARYIFAAVIVFFALAHFGNAEAMSAMLPAGGPIVIYLTGATLILAAVAFFINKQVRLAGYLLAAQLLLTAFLVQMMGMMGAEDEMMKMNFMAQFVKDIGMAMGAIAFANAADS